MYYIYSVRWINILWKIISIYVVGDYYICMTKFIKLGKTHLNIGDNESLTETMILEPESSDHKLFALLMEPLRVQKKLNHLKK